MLGALQFSSFKFNRYKFQDKSQSNRT